MTLSKWVAHSRRGGVAARKLWKFTLRFLACMTLFPKEACRNSISGVFLAKISAKRTGLSPKTGKTENSAETKTLRNAYADYVISVRFHNETPGEPMQTKIQKLTQVAAEVQK